MSDCTVRNVRDLNRGIHPITGEEVYCEHDDDLDQFGVFGCDSGFCYNASSDKEAMETLARSMNE